jgi:hypothetical protein
MTKYFLNLDQSILAGRLEVSTLKVSGFYVFYIIDSPKQ